MAKRKRLTPANPNYLATGLDTPAPSPFSTAPIADVASEAAATAALAEVSDTLEAARREGRMIIELELDAIQMGYLMRDRIPVQDDEMEALKASLRARGQQTPIEVAPLGNDLYGLISGWRRCQALRQLRDSTADARFASVLALVRQPEQSSDAYLAMVEENEIRVGLSFYERARIIARTVEAGVYPDRGAALRALFASASRTKRSKIGSFVSIVGALDGALRYPQSIGERLGLQLAKALEKDSTLPERLGAALEQAAPDGAEAEQDVIQQTLKAQAGPGASTPTKAVPRRVGPGMTIQPGKDSVTLKGPALTEQFQRRLEAWLKSQLR